ncbi:uncharacterized protein LOC143361977 [Halictus rubicundus]|uniref:uncharacterized protein LOC143361977 n=1 Tax=Halictus rubicundus TaxID=77578 RepID=UPI00403543F9
MYVTEGGHKVAPMPTKAKMLDYKTMNEPGDRGGGGGHGGGGGGGAHLAATVKNTFRRLLRRTKSHRDPPSTIPAMVTNTGTGATRPPIGNTPNNTVSIRNKLPNANDPLARRSQPPLPPSNSQHPARTSYNSKRHTRPRVHCITMQK